MGSSRTFEHFFETTEPLVRRALVGRVGAELGRDAAAEAFAVAWSSWERVSVMENPAGYVYRVAERWAHRQTKLAAPSGIEPEVVEDEYHDHELAAALGELSPQQRQAVVLVEGMGMTYREAAELLGCGRSSLQKHLERGLVRLRKNLEVNDNA